MKKEKEKEEIDIFDLIVLADGWGTDINVEKSNEKIRQFLEKAYQEFVDELIEKIEKIPKKPVNWQEINTPDLIAKQSEAYGYNQALSEILEIINKAKEEI